MRVLTLIIKKTKLAIPSDLSDWTLKLYQAAHFRSPLVFKQWCFNHIQSLFSYQTSLWDVGADINRIDESSIAYLSTHSGQFFSGFDDCFNSQSRQYSHTGICQADYCGRNYIAAMSCPNQYANIAHFICFCRHRQTVAFTTQDKHLASSILPHLLQAYNTNLVKSLGARDSLVCGAVDRSGQIVAATEGFNELMTANKLCQGGKVTMPLIAKLKDETLWQSKQVQLLLSVCRGLIYIDVLEPKLSDKLTARQKEICDMIVKGYANKDIAHYMNIEMPTVRNHIQNIYKTLRRRNRAAITEYLLTEGFCYGRS